MSTLMERYRARTRSERLILAVLAVVVVLLIMYLALNFAGSGGSPEAIPTTPAGSTTPEPSVSPTPSQTQPPLTGEVFSGRDPFQALVVASTPGANPTPSSSPGTSGGPSSGGKGTAGGESRRVTLIDIFNSNGKRMATVEVGDKQYTVKEGDRFAQNFQVIDIGARCATFVFGDERFTLCIGQEVRK